MQSILTTKFSVGFDPDNTSLYACVHTDGYPPVNVHSSNTVDLDNRVARMAVERYALSASYPVWIYKHDAIYLLNHPARLLENLDRAACLNYGVITRINPDFVMVEFKPLSIYLQLKSWLINLYRSILKLIKYLVV